MCIRGYHEVTFGQSFRLKQIWNMVRNSHHVPSYQKAWIRNLFVGFAVQQKSILDGSITSFPFQFPPNCPSLDQPKNRPACSWAERVFKWLEPGYRFLVKWWPGKCSGLAAVAFQGDGSDFCTSFLTHTWLV